MSTVFPGKKRGLRLFQGLDRENPVLYAGREKSSEGVSIRCEAGMEEMGRTGPGAGFRPFASSLQRE